MKRSGRNMPLSGSKNCSIAHRDQPAAQRQVDGPAPAGGSRRRRCCASCRRRCGSRRGTACAGGDPATNSCGDRPAFSAAIMIGAPCASSAQTKCTSCPSCAGSAPRCRPGCTPSWGHGVIIPAASPRSSPIITLPFALNLVVGPAGSSTGLRQAQPERDLPARTGSMRLDARPCIRRRDMPRRHSIFHLVGQRTGLRQVNLRAAERTSVA